MEEKKRKKEALSKSKTQHESPQLSVRMSQNLGLHIPAPGHTGVVFGFPVSGQQQSYGLPGLGMYFNSARFECSFLSSPTH